jgi:transposase InsO family protein
VEQAKRKASRPRPPCRKAGDAELLARIGPLIDARPSYGYRRQRQLLRRPHETVAFAFTVGLVPCFTPVRSLESNGIAEAFVKTFKRDYVLLHPRPDAPAVMAQPILGSRTTTRCTIKAPRSPKRLNVTLEALLGGFRPQCPGLCRQEWPPRVDGRLHPATRTPVSGILTEQARPQVKIICDSF